MEWSAITAEDFPKVASVGLNGAQLFGIHVYLECFF
jgi:hypothetical protein